MKSSLLSRAAAVDKLFKMLESEIEITMEDMHDCTETAESLKESINQSLKVEVAMKNLQNRANEAEIYADLLMRLLQYVEESELNLFNLPLAMDFMLEDN